MGLTIKVSGEFKQTTKFLDKILNLFRTGVFDKFGQKGVNALRQYTPKKTGTTANSWYYEINRNSGNVTINWLNSNINKGVLIAVILQYGHGTRNGGYVRGRDYINPAMRSIFQQIADDLWEEVTK